MKGFKATRLDMKCRDYQFSLGTHKHEGEIEPCQSGFHFCKNIEDIWAYYSSNACRIFEVEATGETIENGDKVVTNEINFIREINYEDFIGHHNYWVRRVVANKGIGLDILVNDRDPDVRRYVAKQGYGLDILANDVHWEVRRYVELYQKTIKTALT